MVEAVAEDLLLFYAERRRYGFQAKRLQLDSQNLDKCGYDQDVMEAGMGWCCFL